MPEITPEAPVEAVASTQPGTATQPEILPGTTTALADVGVQPDDVLSATNISDTIKAPAPRPDDLLGIRAGIQAELGIPTLQTEFQEAMAGLQRFDISTQERTAMLKSRPESIELIRGRRRELTEQRAIEKGSLAAEAQVLQSRLFAAQQEAQAQFGIRQSQFETMQNLILQVPGAGITFGDSIETAAKKIDKYVVEEKKEIRKQAEKDAFDQAFFNVFGTDRGKLSRKEAGKKLKKEFKSKREFEKEMKSLQLEKERATIAKIKSTIDKATKPETPFADVPLTPNEALQYNAMFPGAGVVITDTAGQAADKVNRFQEFTQRSSLATEMDKDFAREDFDPELDRSALIEKLAGMSPGISRQEIEGAVDQRIGDITTDLGESIFQQIELAPHVKGTFPMLPTPGLPSFQPKGFKPTKA